MSSLTSNLTIAINDIKQSMMISVQIWSICYIVFGIIGHTFNIYIFTRRQLILNPCVRYFLASSVSGYVVVCSIIPVRLLQLGYNIDILISSTSLCQFLLYFFFCLRVLPSWFIALASIDRFLSSSSTVTLRRWSNTRVANRTILVTIVFIGLVYIHLPFVHTIVLPQRTCGFITPFYQGFYAIWNLIFWSWLPSLCMLIFGLLIIQHIRQGARRIGIQNVLQRNKDKTDRQLIQMLLMQSFVLASTTTTLSIGMLYIAITNSLKVKNDLEKAQELYLQQILNYIGLIGPCMNFYIFTLSSQLFRRELYTLFSRQQRAPVAHIINVGERR